MFFQKYKKIILIILGLVILFFVYSYFSGNNSADEELLTSSIQVDPAQVVGTEIISALNQIESLKLSRDIFEDPVYRSLVDRSEPIPQEPIGKSNPFSPIGSSVIRNVPTSTTTSSGSSQSRPNTIINTTNKPANVPVI